MGHSSMTDFSHILRIYDFMVSSMDQHVGLYMVCAVLLSHKEEILALSDFSEFITFTKEHIRFDDEVVLNRCMKKCHKIIVSQNRERARKEMWRSSVKRVKNN